MEKRPTRRLGGDATPGAIHSLSLRVVQIDTTYGVDATGVCQNQLNIIFSSPSTHEVILDTTTSLICFPP